MKRLLTGLSLVGLGLTVAPSCLAYAGALEPLAMKHWMLAGTILWFAAATWRDRLR